MSRLGSPELPCQQPSRPQTREWVHQSCKAARTLTLPLSRLQMCEKERLLPRATKIWGWGVCYIALL